MPLSRISFQGCKLYAIIDRSVLGGRDPAEVAEAAIRGGAEVIQWRDKQARDGEFLQVALRLRELTRRLKALFVVNDRVDVALLAKADGLHLGHEDLPVRQARTLGGRSLLIGRSTHSLPEALEAQAAGADYIGVGPIFATPTKPEAPAVGLELIRAVKPAIRIPWVAIGGIDLGNLPLVLSAGADRIAVVRAVAGAADPERAARSFKEILD
ncbi:MAG: thiamine phosphate synthase [Candidatus Omnitrophica bacterium]|nr:thiamine phosphate synthase [Candidatus Omnitrophota bacterium]